MSCDIRFFPLGGFRPSKVHVLGDDAPGDFRRGLAANDGETLRAPYLEAAGHMGLREEPVECPAHSILNWSNFVMHTERGDLDAALVDLTRFTNAEMGIDGVDAYASKFHGRTIHRSVLDNLLQSLRAIDPSAPEVMALERRAGAVAAAAT